MTSYALSGDQENLLAAGCSAYIEKQIEAVIGTKAITKETVTKGVESKTKSSESKNENSNC